MESQKKNLHFNAKIYSLYAKNGGQYFKLDHRKMNNLDTRAISKFALCSFTIALCFDGHNLMCHFKLQQRLSFLYLQQRVFLLGTQNKYLCQGASFQIKLEKKLADLLLHRHKLIAEVSIIDCLVFYVVKPYTNFHQDKKKFVSHFNCTKSVFFTKFMKNWEN